MLYPYLDVTLGVGHREAPLSIAGAKRLAAPGPLVPRHHLLLVDDNIFHPEHTMPEPDVVEDAEVARVGVEVVEHLAVVWIHIRDGVRPREIGVVVHRPR